MENQMILPYEIEDRKLVYKMPKELDHHVAQRLCKEMDMLVDAHQIKELVLDFTKTEFMDSSGIGVVIGRSKTMQFHGGEIYAAHMGKRVEMIFKSAGLYKIVAIKEG